MIRYLASRPSGKLIVVPSTRLIVIFGNLSPIPSFSAIASTPIKYGEETRDKTASINCAAKSYQPLWRHSPDGAKRNPGWAALAIPDFACAPSGLPLWATRSQNHDHRNCPDRRQAWHGN